jgi:hypothetical protein
MSASRVLRKYLALSGTAAERQDAASAHVIFHFVSDRNRNNKLTPDYAREQASNYFTFYFSGIDRWTKLAGRNGSRPDGRSGTPRPACRATEIAPYSPSSGVVWA